jgi:hypothetical protein
MYGSVLQRRRNFLVSSLGAGCKLPPPRLRILEQHGQPRMDLPATWRIRRLERTGGKQGVRETDLAFVRLDDAGVEGR